MQANTYYYQDGTAVRKEVKELPNRFSRRMEKWDEAERLKKERYKRQVTELRNGRIFTTAVVLATVLLCSFFVSYVSLNNDITTELKNISSLQAQINELKASNAAAESRISMITNLDDVKQTALTELGMVYANKDQIVYYTMESRDYMTQYKDMQ